MKHLISIAAACTILAIAALMLYPVWQESGSRAAGVDSLLNQDILGDGSEIILPIPASLNLDPKKVELGEQLFGEAQLSSNGFSCKTCHPLESGGMDSLEKSIVNTGGFDQMNTPTIFNVGFNSLQQWNGGTQTLEQQLDRVINNPRHMASSWDRVIARLNDSTLYRKRFSAIYQDGVTRANITDAITTFERSLITPHAAFDRYLNGDANAISAQQKKGYELFQQYGCSSCHQGINIGGNLLAKFGIFETNHANKDPLSDYDYGRFFITRKQQDKFLFRVPSLRNVSRTAPYFHDGSVATLKQAIKTMESNPDQPHMK